MGSLVPPLLSLRAGAPPGRSPWAAPPVPLAAALCGLGLCLCFLAACPQTAALAHVQTPLPFRIHPQTAAKLLPTVHHRPRPAPLGLPSNSAEDPQSQTSSTLTTQKSMHFGIFIFAARVCGSLAVGLALLAASTSPRGSVETAAIAATSGLTTEEAATGGSAAAAGASPQRKRSLFARIFRRRSASPPPSPSAEPTTTTALVRASADQIPDTYERPLGEDRPPFRLKTWQILLLGGLALYFGSWLLNTIIMGVLETHVDSVTLGHDQVEEVANALVEAEKQLRYDVIMGHMQKMTEPELMTHLRTIGLKLEENTRISMLRAAANSITDVLVALCLALGVIVNKARVSELFGGIWKRFMSLSNTTQAFLLLLVSDVIVGYHSSDGWFTVLKLIGNHYGLSEHHYESVISIFVAVVPVGLDVAFKFWVFKELRRLSPSTQVILGEIDRH